MSKKYIPHRNDIIWLDFEPKKGHEIGKYRPALVLSAERYNQQTGLVICCPISTSIRGHMMEVLIHNLEEPSVVASNFINTYSWRDRKAKFIQKAQRGVMQAVLQRVIPLIGADKLMQS